MTQLLPLKRHQAERGAALIVALVMLLIMTLLGVASVDTTVIEERMAGQFRNKQNSFDAAEAGLREGEQVADSLTLIAPQDGTNGLYAAVSGGIAVWDDPATTWRNRANPALPDVVTQPQFVIEKLPRPYIPPTCVDPSEYPRCQRHIYRVTARGFGINTNAATITQSTVALRK